MHMLEDQIQRHLPLVPLTVANVQQSAAGNNDHLNNRQTSVHECGSFPRDNLTRTTSNMRGDEMNGGQKLVTSCGLSISTTFTF